MRLKFLKLISNGKWCYFARLEITKGDILLNLGDVNKHTMINTICGYKGIVSFCAIAYYLGS